MIKLIVALTFQISTPPVILTYDFQTMGDCLKHKQEKVAVLDTMNQQSITIGYSAVCK